MLLQPKRWLKVYKLHPEDAITAMKIDNEGSLFVAACAGDHEAFQHLIDPYRR